MSIDDELRWDGELTVSRHDRETGTTFVIRDRRRVARGPLTIPPSVTHWRTPGSWPAQ